MLDYMIGIVEEIGDNYLVLEIGGIGYRIITSSNTIRDIYDKNKVKIYTHMHIKEDAITLYGFSNKLELDIFKHLISVTGVGPKAALSLLSYLKPNEFIISIQDHNVKTLTQVPGIGKKIAERIILELKDKMKIDFDSNAMIKTNDTSNKNLSEVIDALMSLGYSYREASSAYSKIKDKDKSLDNLIKDALKQLSQI